MSIRSHHRGCCSSAYIIILHKWSIRTALLHGNSPDTTYYMKNLTNVTWWTQTFPTNPSRRRQLVRIPTWTSLWRGPWFWMTFTPEPRGAYLHFYVSSKLQIKVAKLVQHFFGCWRNVNLQSCKTISRAEQKNISVSCTGASSMKKPKDDNDESTYSALRWNTSCKRSSFTG